MWKRSLNIAILCGSWIFFLLVSCVDQSYDLSKDIDLTMNVGGQNLTLPMGNTEIMYLSKFVKVEDEEDALLQEEKEEGEHKGEYKLLKAEDMEPTDVKIEEVIIEVDPTRLGDDDKYWKIPILSDYTPGDPLNLKDDDDDAPLLTFEGELVLENDDMPKEIISIYKLGLIESNYPKLSLIFEATITDADGKSVPEATIRIVKIILENFEMEFPECLDLKKSTGGEGEMKGSTYTRDNATIAPNDKLFSLDLQSISFGDIDPLRGLVMESIEGGGTVGYGFKRPYPVSLKSVIAITLSSAPTEKLHIKLTPVIRIDDILIATVTGQIKPTLEEVTDVVLGELPDFLTDPEVRLDLANPQVFLTVINPIDIPISFYVTMQGIKEGETSPRVPIETPKITIPALQTTTIILSKLGGVDDPINHIQYTKIAKLNELFLLTIPEQINLDINSKKANITPEEEKQENEGLPRSTIVLGGDEKMVVIDYEIDMPLSFGKGLVIIYNETINGWNDQIKDLEMDNISITTTVENTIPLELHIEGYAIDVNGNELKGIDVEAKRAIAAGEGIGEKKKPKKTSITISISEKKDKDYSGQMKEMDGVVLRFKANATETVNGIPLNSSQYLIMDKISAKITGGMNIDLN
ncbi:hypothetical protein EZS27_026141 [termite gut metagenome]|uniref:Uncharacterized protein n=1 Tax=termite gut metagenome TaxID=433724 RepID=A0A5J4QSN9_9ZZZZ